MNKSRIYRKVGLRASYQKSNCLKSKRKKKLQKNKRISLIYFNFRDKAEFSDDAF